VSRVGEEERNVGEPWKHEFVEANGIRFHYVTAGSGPLVVLLHGFPQFWYGWRHQIAALASRYRVVAPDLRGYGDTDKPKAVAAYRTSILAEDVAALIHALGEERAAVVGHDWGGGVAWTTALEHPEVVDRLCVLNCPHPRVFARHLRSNFRQLLRSWYVFFFQIPMVPELVFRIAPRRSVEQMFRKMAKRRETFSDQDLDEFRAALSKPGALTGAINYYRAAFRDFAAQRAVWADERKIAAPTLLIWAEDDVALGKELTIGMEPLFSDGFRIHYVPNCSHWVNEEQPELVNRLLLEFLGDRQAA
jgi:epoxide hydrolase 4